MIAATGHINTAAQQFGKTAGRCCPIADGQTTQADIFYTLQNLEDAIACHTAIAIYNGLVGSGALDGQVSQDIQVTNQGIIVVPGAAELVYTRWQQDRIGIGREICLHDGGAQRALTISVGTHTVGRVRIGCILSAVNQISAGS